MDNEMIIRIWKDKAFRSQTNIEGPAHPAGSGDVLLESLDLGDMITSPHPLCSEGPRCPY